MPYDIRIIQEAIKDGRKRAVINRAIYHQNRIKFHTVKRVGSGLMSPFVSEPLTQFMAMAENILPHDKFVLFKTLFRWPVKTNEITSVCFDKLSRIFDGRNPAFDYQFASGDMADDWESYRRDRLHEPFVWQTKGWEFFKTDINSVLVVDMPVVQYGENPEPYFYWIPIDSVLTYDADVDSGVMRFIAFRRPKEIVVIDDSSYRVYSDPKGTGNIDESSLMYENAHDLGYCPARFFWNESISLDDPDIKESPLTKELANLDWYLFFHISKHQLDLMGAYPILSGYEQSCDYSNAENGDYCDGGFLRDKQGRYRLDMAGALLRCPKCGNKRIVGAGSFVEIPIPNEEQGQPDLRNPVQMLTVDRNALDYNVGEEKRLRAEIIESIVGQSEIVTDREAYNEQQVKANFESATTILNRIKKGFESAQKWVDDTVCRLRYGSSFVSSSIDYGTDFYLSTVSELRDDYNKARQSGASESELDAMYMRILDTEYRNNPTMLGRMRILAELEPYRHLSMDEVVDMNRNGMMSDRDMFVKANFMAYVRRFERENMDVQSFGAAIPYAQKIDRINDELTKYSEETKKSITQKKIGL